MTPRPFVRSRSLAALRDETFDVVVVGGGITGAGVRPRRRLPGPAHRPVERDDFAVGHVVEVLEARPRRPALPAAGRDPPRLRGPRASASACCSNAPHLVTVLPFLIPMFGTDGVITRQDRPALGTAMWVYDLTGGAAHRQAPQAPRPTTRRWRTCPRCPPTRLVVGLPVLRRPGRRRPPRARPSPAPRRSTTAPSSPTGVARRPACRKDADGRVDGVDGRGRRRGASRSRAHAVVNAAGVWSDDVRALDEGTDPDSIRPAKGIHITVPWDKVRNDIAAVIPVPKDTRSVFVVPWGDFTYIGTTDTDYDGPVDDPQCTPEDIDYLLRRHQRRVIDRAITARRHRRHLGRAAPAGEGGPTAAAPPTCPASTRCAGSGSGRRHHHRRQAHDLPRDGRGHRRRGRRDVLDAATPAPRQAAARHQASCALRGADGLRRRWHHRPPRTRRSTPSLREHLGRPLRRRGPRRARP